MICAKTSDLVLLQGATIIHMANCGLDNFSAVRVMGGVGRRVCVVLVRSVAVRVRMISSNYKFWFHCRYSFGSEVDQSTGFRLCRWLCR